MTPPCLCLFNKRIQVDDSWRHQVLASCICRHGTCLPDLLLPFSAQPKDMPITSIWLTNRPWPSHQLTCCTFTHPPPPSLSFLKRKKKERREKTHTHMLYCYYLCCILPRLHASSDWRFGVIYYISIIIIINH